MSRTSAGRYGAALLFVRWSPAGDRPVGHVETGSWRGGKTQERGGRADQAASLYDVKAALERRSPTPPGNGESPGHGGGAGRFHLPSGD